MSGASGHGEEPMADPCVNARRTRRITARQSHLPKIRDDRKSVDRHEQIGLRYGSRSSTIGPASSRLKRKPASSRTARRQAADRVLMCTGFWRPPAKSPSVPAIAQQSSPPISSEKIAQIVTSSDRTVADRANDVRRKPEQTLGFIGIHSPYRRGRSQPGRRNVANEALLTIVAAASIHSHSRGDHHEG